MRLIVTSQQDRAGVNIYQTLARGFGFTASGEFEGKPVYKRAVGEEIWLIATAQLSTMASHLDEHFDPEYYVVASRHRSEGGGKILTVHAPGNLGERAQAGGRPKELAYANPEAMKVALRELKAAVGEKGLAYQVAMEATHHGPTELRRPVLFVEVGSGPEEWEDPRAVEAVGAAALKAAENREAFPRAIGIGGKHYAPIHTKFALESAVAIGHVIPEYALDALDPAILAHAVARSKAAFGLLDWKGMRREQREKVLSMASSLELELKRGRDLLKENI
ncbi:MAG: hypothetical protein HY555_02875 [Euryarchaeota archaeon]|nr:hypothetical protein [Euryarchaeota archaeon]